MLLIQHCSNITLQAETSICFNPVFAVAAYVEMKGGGSPLENWGAPQEKFGAQLEKKRIFYSSQKHSRKISSSCCKLDIKKAKMYKM